MAGWEREKNYFLARFIQFSFVNLWRSVSDTIKIFNVCFMIF